jgi:hypothetical protein
VPCPAGSAEGALMGDADDVRDWLRARHDDLVAELIGWVRIRSVMGPLEHAVELRRSAQWLAVTRVPPLGVDTGGEPAAGGWAEATRAGARTAPRT